MGQARDQSGRYVRLADGLANLASGAGTSADKRQHAFYAQSYETPQQIEAWYRTSWLARKLVDLPPFDMTREGRLWQVDKASAAKIMAEENRLGLWDKVRQALVLGRLGGGAIVMGIAGDTDPSQPLNAPSVRAKGLTYLAVFNRWQIGTGPMVLNPTDPLFGQPEYFVLSQGDARGLRIHPSRVVAFRGKPIPALSGSSGSSWFWGDSEMMTAKDAVQNADAAMNGFASLIEEAKLDTVTIPGLTNYLRDAEGEALVIKRVTVANQIKSTHNARILDGGNGKDKPGETWETRQVSWAGMPQVIQTYLAIVAGAADIPATRFLSESPGGMNATGDSDLDNYYAMIGTRQEAMRALLEQIDVALIPSAGVVMDAGATFTFPPLVQKSEADEAETFSTWAAGIASLQSGGLVPTIALEKGAQNRLSGEAWLPGISEALGELSEEERFPSLAPPETGGDGEPVDPSAIAEGGDPASIGSGGVDGSGAARRRAANDALVAAGLEPSLIRIVMDALPEVGDTPSRPFDDAAEDQPRDEHGRWTSGAAHQFIRNAASNRAVQPAHVLGEVDHTLATHLASININGRGKTITLEHGRVRHTLANHSGPGEVARGQIQVTHGDLAAAHDLLNRSHDVKVGNPPTSREGHARFEATTTHEGKTYTIVGEARRRAITIVTMWKK